MYSDISKCFSFLKTGTITLCYVSVINIIYYITTSDLHFLQYLIRFYKCWRSTNASSVIPLNKCIPYIYGGVTRVLYRGSLLASNNIISRITFLRQAFIVKYVKFIHFCGVKTEKFILVVQCYRFVMIISQKLILHC